MSGPFPAAQPCQTCGTTLVKTYTCIQCNNLAFCDACWPRWVLHVAGAVGWNGKPHEKADPAVVHRLRQILEPTRTEAEHEAELQEDEDTTWFGFGRDGAGQPVLHDYGRFAAIMGETFSEDAGERYPQLVSFIGETGAGKSTLIKLLIDRQDLDFSEGSRYYSPVTSSNHDRIPTTGDVHLYADPSSLASATPTLLVDCEGLSGGEAMPKQLKHRSLDGASPANAQQQQQQRYSHARPLSWARTPQTRKREYAVSQLYPRILYTFSDVVVFVLRNPRAFESTVLDKLLHWGAASIDKSLNQPVLPHAVLVLNATDAGVADDEWDVAAATRMLLADIQGAIHREPALQEHVRTWRRRGKEIRTTRELLECYYGSVHVVRVPYKGSYMLMHEQAGKLAALIRDRCAKSHLRKKKVRMLATTERLQFYLQAACDHFTRDLDTPFDFVKETLRHSPVSRNFEGNILHLALLIRDWSRSTALKNRAEAIFRAMAPMIASCVMFDTVRQNLLGTASQLLDDRYARPCAAALERFADMYWPCSYTNPDHGGELGRCCNVRSGHNPKGHQNRQGRIIGHGDYESDLDVAAFGPVFTQLLRASLTQLQASAFKLGQEFVHRSELETTALMHRERLNELYSNILGNATDFVSYSACLCCLRELPECVLPCGHILCLPCVQVYGQRTSKTTIEISRCPLHVRDTIATPPWVITTKPPQAGARILCLDGGGVRGIVQLQVLREIEKMLGPGLPIQLFFDLMVGTNIIAMGLGIKKWTVSATMEKFKDLCREGFTPREMNSLPLFGALSSLYHGSLYKTSPFAKALRRYFSDQPFFGGATHRSVHNTSVKVAVTASAKPGKQAVVFANYNRPDPQGKNLPYRFTRSDVPSHEVRIWEAARATSATSPFFKPFVKPETGNEYADGGPRHACPVVVAHHESKALWADVAHAPPDLLLSIGTGRNVGDRDEASASLSTNSMTDISTTAAGSSAVLKGGRGGAGNYKRQQSAAREAQASEDAAQRSASSGYLVRNPNAPLLVHFNNPLAGAQQQLTSAAGQADRTWARFRAGPAVEKRHRPRYLRVCPEFLARLPKFDEVEGLDTLEREAERYLQQGPAEVAEAAQRLVASTFFFEKDTASVKQTDSGFQCTGSIFCRFREASAELKSLGWHLISYLVDDFEPYFAVAEQDGRSPPRPAVVLTNQVLQDMHQHGHFQPGPVPVAAAAGDAEVTISLCLAPPRSAAAAPPLRTAAEPATGGLPISGFPRRLMLEDGAGTIHPLASTVYKQDAPLPSQSAIQRPPLTIRRQPTGSTTCTTASSSSPGAKTLSPAAAVSPPTTPPSSVHHPAFLADHAKHVSELPGSYPVAELQ